MDSSFSISEAFKYGWETFKKHWKFLIPYFIVIGIIQFLFSYLGGEKSPLGFLSFFVSIASIFVTMFLSASLIKTVLMIYHNKEISLSQNIFCATRGEAWKYFKTSVAMMLYLLPVILIIIALIIFGGISLMDHQQMWPFILLASIALLVGIVFYTAYFMFPYYIASEYKLSSFGNIKYGFKISKGHMKKLVLFSFASNLVLLFGFIALIVGVFVALPVVMFALVYIYKKLDAQYQATQGAVSHEHITHDVEPVTTVEIQPQEIAAPTVEEGKE